MSPRIASARRAVVVLSVLVYASAARAEYQLEPAYPGLVFIGPTDIQPANDGTNRMFVVEKRGLIWVFESDYNTVDKTEFLDLSDTVTPKGEGGLLGLTFHPDYEDNGYFYVFYVTKTPNRSILARYHVSADPDVANPNSRVILIDVAQPDVFHNGGQLAFGDDGDQNRAATGPEAPRRCRRRHSHIDRHTLVGTRRKPAHPYSDPVRCASRLNRL